MSFETYHVPVALAVKMCRSYNMLMRVEAIALNPGYQGHIETIIDAIVPRFDEFVKKLIKEQGESDMADLFEWLYPAIRHNMVNYDMVDDAVGYSLFKQGIDGPVDMDMFRNMFANCKNARSLVELNYMLRPEWMLNIPNEEWSDAQVDAFYKSLLD